MRLVTIASDGGLSLGVVSRRILDLPDLGRWPMTMRELAGAGPAALAAIDAWAQGTSGGRPLASVRLGPPIPNPGKIVAIGLNYADHAAEGNVAVPTAPLVFAKFPTTIVGPDDVITWDRGLTDRVDYEAELGVVIGARARNVSEADALGHVFGYTCVNDVSARDLQFGDGQWVRGKSLDTFCPVGPVDRHRRRDPGSRRRSGSRASSTARRSRTRRPPTCSSGCGQLVSYCSRAFTLEPGDLIATGTPAGVGVYKKPPRLLRDGDEMVIRIERIGDLRNVCRTTGEPTG